MAKKTGKMNKAQQRLKEEKMIPLKLISKRWKQHKEERDIDGFSCCPVIDQFETRVASKEKWLGTEESRQESLKDQKIMDKKISCDFCSLCSELINILRTKMDFENLKKEMEGK